MPKPDDLRLDHVAALARIDLTAEEKERFAAQLGDVLAYVAQLNEIDVSGVEPTAHAFPIVNVWAADIPEPGLSVEEALRNAPEKRDNMFVVPRVVE
ncbi:MAG TPA: Asp-tRNA(Asn)/Glu-tRNA(Gln) amidotransferase subunit GatC [Opitutaceae bacterium]|jgi:aspartyl-tRNA(Asn)/glutamyl-tRNA(Gln) amidotransferase subunit C